MKSCGRNPELRIERNKDGELIVMAPVGGTGSERNLEPVVQLATWAKADGRGKAFDATCGFILPNGAMRPSDAAWVTLPRLNALTAVEREKFLPLCPEFVAELRSRTDTLRGLLDKMRDYMENGAQLGWLIDPGTRGRFHIYRPNQEPQILEYPATVSADQPLTGFVLDLAEIW